MKIDVIGCGSAFSTEQITSSLLVSDTDNKQWLIDCGPTVPRALWKRGLDINQIQVIYFTHIHPDHCCGLPALLNQWKSFGRTEPLEIYCQPQHKASLEALVDLAIWPKSELCFALHWHSIADEFLWHDWQIRTAFTQHEVSNRAIQIRIGEHSLFYSGDGRPTEGSIALMKGVDLAFQECASAVPLPADSSHGDIDQCLLLNEKCGATALGLYHCYDEYLPELQNKVASIPGLFLSYDGLSIDLRNRDNVEQ